MRAAVGTALVVRDVPWVAFAPALAVSSKWPRHSGRWGKERRERREIKM